MIYVKRSVFSLSTIVKIMINFKVIDYHALSDFQEFLALVNFIIDRVKTIISVQGICELHKLRRDCPNGQSRLSMRISPSIYLNLVDLKKKKKKKRTTCAQITSDQPDMSMYFLHVRPVLSERGEYLLSIYLIDDL